MYLIPKHPFLGLLLLAFISVQSSFANFSTTPTLVVKNIVCPQICRGETTYKIIFEVTDGVVSASRGVIRNDTIFDVIINDYLLKITVLGNNGEKITKTIELPICGPILPIAPIGANQQICEGSPLPLLSVFVPEPTAAVDWFDQPVGGKKLAADSLVFQPAAEGIFYAESRFAVSGCVSLSRTPVALRVQRVLCPLVFTRKVKVQ